MDLLRLADFLVEKSPRAAMRAVATIETSLLSLRDLPDRTPSRDGDVRELMIPFNASGYVARYRVRPDHVLILRIFHMREDR